MWTRVSVEYLCHRILKLENVMSVRAHVAASFSPGLGQCCWALSMVLSRSSPACRTVSVVAVRGAEATLCEASTLSWRKVCLMLSTKLLLALSVVLRLWPKRSVTCPNCQCDSARWYTIVGGRVGWGVGVIVVNELQLPV